MDALRKFRILLAILHRFAVVILVSCLGEALYGNLWLGGIVVVLIVTGYGCRVWDFRRQAYKADRHELRQSAEKYSGEDSAA